MESASVASENEEDLPADTPSANSTGSVAGSGSTNDAIGSISVDDAAGSGSASNTTGSTPSEESSVENASSTSENTSENEAQKKNSTTDASSVANTDTDAFSASNSTADAPSAANTATDALSTANTTAGVLSASNANTTSVAHSEDGPTITYYYSVADAMSAAENGKIIYMDCDWNLTSALVIPKNTEVNINMNCHSISNNGSSEVIHMEKESYLILGADEKTTFTYKGYTSIKKYTSAGEPDAEDKDMKDITVECGGLVTGGRKVGFFLTSQAGGIYMEDYSRLDLHNVVVAGNYVDGERYNNNAGGIFANEGCIINLTDGSSIEHNKGLVGGIFITGDDVDIALDNSFIKQNYSFEYGGGIYSNNYNTSIHLENGSAIEGNVATKDGGGVYFNYTAFTLESGDLTGEIKDNVAGDPSRGWAGGGVYVNSDSDATEENRGSITGITFSGNTCGDNGGALYLNQMYTVVSDCIIKENTATKYGGGVNVNSNYCIMRDCTVTDNVCNLGGKNYEGGGIYVGFWDSLELSGVMIVKGNTRGENGSKDDLFLGDASWHTSNSYITGGVKQGSSIGIRTGATDDTCIGKHINNETKDSFFIDLDGYYVSYGTDDGGDMWQRHKKLEFLLSINGEEVGRYNYDVSVTANGAATSSSKHFWYWDAGETTGLYPVSDFITDDNKFDQSLTFAMPQNDANLVAVYADKVKQLGLFVEAPVAGKAFSLAGILKRMDTGTGGIEDVNVSLSWYEVSESGAEVAVSGIAQAGKTYFARVTVQPSQRDGLFFSQGITEEDVTVYEEDCIEQGVMANYAAVNPSTGVLSIATDDFKTAPPSGGDDDPDDDPDSGGDDSNPDDSGSDGSDGGAEADDLPAAVDSSAVYDGQDVASGKSSATPSTGDMDMTYEGAVAAGLFAGALTCAACAYRKRRDYEADAE